VDQPDNRLLRSDLPIPPRSPTPVQMRAGLLRTSLRFLTWVCGVLLAVLSLMRLEKIEAVRTDLPGQVEHIIASTALRCQAGARRSAGWGTLMLPGWEKRRQPQCVGWFKASGSHPPPGHWQAWKGEWVPPQWASGPDVLDLGSQGRRLRLSLPRLASPNTS
jgi:hypothetical protein